MRNMTIEGIVTAVSSISHIGETRGVAALLRREKVLTPAGDIEEIPVLSGNGMRGPLRDLGMLHMCRALGYGVNEQTGEVNGLSLAAHHFLFSGGALTGDTARGLNVATARRMRDLIPLVSVLGGAMGNQIMPGKVEIGKLVPICAETGRIVPPRFMPDRPLSIWELTQMEDYTRRDDSKDERFRHLLTADARALVDGKHAADWAKKGTADDIDREVGQHQQMRYSVETLAAGTELYWYIVLKDVTDIEFEAFLTCLVEFSRRPHVGGKGAIGHGRVAVKFESWLEMDPRISPTGREIDAPIGTRYAAHLTERGGDIRDELARLA